MQLKRDQRELSEKLVSSTRARGVSDLWLAGKKIGRVMERGF